MLQGSQARAPPPPKPVRPGAWAPQPEKPLRWEVRPPQLEKACVQPRRPSTAINK